MQSPICFDVDDAEIVVGGGWAGQLNGDFVVSPREEPVVVDAGPPFVTAVGARMKQAAPGALSRVAGAGEQQHVASMYAVAEEFFQLCMNRAAAFAIAPARHAARA